MNESKGFGKQLFKTFFSSTSTNKLLSGSHVIKQVQSMEFAQSIFTENKSMEPIYDVMFQ